MAQYSTDEWTGQEWVTECVIEWMGVWVGDCVTMSECVCVNE